MLFRRRLYGAGRPGDYPVILIAEDEREIRELIIMPKMDSFEACRVLKQQEETKNIPVVFLSAKGQEADIKMGYDVGAEAYFLKPFTPEELPKRLIRVLSKHGKM